MQKAITCSKITLPLNTEIQLQIIPCCELDEFPCVEEMEIVLLDNTKQPIKLYSDVCVKAIAKFIDLLTCSLNGCLELHESIGDDLGLLWNEYCQKKQNPNLWYVRTNPFPLWIGHSYLLWTVPAYFEPQVYTWLYTQNGKIYLEITPNYRWHFMDPKPTDVFIPYDEFVKNYKPIARYEIPREIAAQWLEQAKEFLKKAHEIFDVL